MIGQGLRAVGQRRPGEWRRRRDGPLGCHFGRVPGVGTQQATILVCCVIQWARRRTPDHDAASADNGGEVTPAD